MRNAAEGRILRELDREIRRLRPLEDLVHVGGGAAIQVRKVRAIGHKAPGIRTFPPRVQGTTTFGKALAHCLDHPHFDRDDFFWLPTDPPFQQKRDRPVKAVQPRPVARETVVGFVPPATRCSASHVAPAPVCACGVTSPSGPRAASESPACFPPMWECGTVLEARLALVNSKEPDFMAGARWCTVCLSRGQSEDGQRSCETIDSYSRGRRRAPYGSVAGRRVSCRRV